MLNNRCVLYICCRDSLGMFVNDRIVPVLDHGFISFLLLNSMMLFSIKQSSLMLMSALFQFVIAIALPKHNTTCCNPHHNLLEGCLGHQITA